MNDRFDGRAAKWVLAAAAVLALSLSPVVVGAAHADPSSPGTGPTTTSTSDELADMVMGVIDKGRGAAPTTTVVPAPAP
jgi:hypothetical protein